MKDIVKDTSRSDRTEPIRALVIGAGNIAHRFDSPDDEVILTHIKAYHRNPAFQLVGVCDTRIDEAKIAAERWNIPHYAATPEELQHLKPEVISICSPDNTHEDYLRRCLQLNTPPRLVFCEKPLATEIQAAEHLVQEYECRGIYLAVNYSRRWWAELQTVRQNIQAGIYGNIVSARLKYYKGLQHNASHLIDLIQFFLEPRLIDGVILQEIQDYTPDDPTVSFACTMDSPSGNFVLMGEGYDSRQMTPIELELTFEKQQILLSELDGTRLILASLRENALYPGFFEFSKQTRVTIDGSQAMRNAVIMIKHCVQSGEPLPSTGKSACETLDLCSRIMLLPRLDRELKL